MRIGIGFDVHKFKESRPLVLGGVEIPFKFGLMGYSDADVLIHAIIDAALGAAGMGDLGSHFPDSDEQYKDISSMVLLARTVDILADSGYGVVNLDTVIMLEEPRLESYKPEMEKMLAEALGIKIDQVNVKATTTEGLGFTGRKEGIAASAIVLIQKND